MMLNKARQHLPIQKVLVRMFMLPLLLLLNHRYIELMLTRNLVLVLVTLGLEQKREIRKSMRRKDRR